MRRSRFLALQLALFLGGAPVVAAAADQTTGDGRHRVLRRHMQGQPAFVVGDLGYHTGLAPDDPDQDAFIQGTTRAVQAFLRAHGGGIFAAAPTLHAVGRLRRSRNGQYHLRLQQTCGEFIVEGGNLMAHTDSFGQLVGMNGEYVDCQAALLEIPARWPGEAAMASALAGAGIASASVIQQSAPELTLVVADDLSCCLAYKSIINYWRVDEEGSRSRAQDLVYADASNGLVCARDPLIWGNRQSPPTLRAPPHSSSSPNHEIKRLLESDVAPIINTFFCVPGDLTEDPIETVECSLASDSPEPIETGVEAVDAAHNFALITFWYYWRHHGLNSLDGEGHELRSYVLSDDFNYANAYWNGSEMTYGDGGDRLNALSMDADVVGHEFTHGVTSYASRLIYRDESGALNEAMSDIFGALIDREAGATGSDIWLIGEDIVKRAGGAFRDMSNPSRFGHFDYYPDRFLGEEDSGGVHWNSGIANLAFVLLLEGGRHPRDATDVVVPGLVGIFGGDVERAFEVAGDIFFCANNDCLTRHSSFEDARYCTAIVCGSSGLPEDSRIVDSIHAAWQAVGVGGEMQEPTERPSVSPTRLLSATPSLAPTAPPSPMLLESSDATSTPPTVRPSSAFSQNPTDRPSLVPDTAPTSTPTSQIEPTSFPTIAPTTWAPTAVSTLGPTFVPTRLPTLGPTLTPSIQPSPAATLEPTEVPTRGPTAAPSGSPSATPSTAPSSLPTERPSVDLSLVPSGYPSSLPSADPSSIPSSVPTTIPSGEPTAIPSETPTSIPSSGPTAVPTRTPTTTPTFVPSSQPTDVPSSSPSSIPTTAPSTSPSETPTEAPTVSPSAAPSVLPSSVPSTSPSETPTVTPTAAPSTTPSVLPSSVPSSYPTDVPSLVPTSRPTMLPSEAPSADPSRSPTSLPTSTPVLVFQSEEAPPVTNTTPAERLETSQLGQGNESDDEKGSSTWWTLWGGLALTAVSLSIALVRNIRKDSGVIL